MRPTVRVIDHRGHREDVVTSHDLVSVDLRDGALGLVDPVDPAGPSLARFVVGQLAVLLPPGELEVVAVVGSAAAPRWRWLWLLPHVLPGAVQRTWPVAAGVAARRVADLVERRRADPAGRPATSGQRPAVLVVVDDPAGEVPAGDLGWLQHAHEVDVHVVCVAARRETLPHGCRTLVVPASADGVEVRALRPRGGSSAVVVADRVGPWWADALGRALAPLRSPGVQGPAELPARVRLDHLVDTSPDAVARRWSMSPDGSLAVPLGLGAAGPAVVDLVRDGPHALLAGTTGSGKSELLRAWLLGLAALYPPDHVALLLVDYKGGATFDDLVGLPHTVGLLTDLDGGATARVLHALRAEVRRRERLLATADARDLTAYRALRTGTVEPLPRLLVVVDEFRVLAEDAPDVLGAFVRLAATGRSLGVHLVLATQRPGGVVSADIRANASLRICLRVQDAGESRDVVDRPDAASLPADRPGRAVVVGAGIDLVMQGAWLGPAYDDPRSRRGRVRVASSVPPQRDGPGSAAPAGPTPAATAVARVRQAVEQSGRGAAVSPWLAPLPERIDSVPGRARPRRRAVVPGPTPPGAEGLLLGTTDLPWEQAYGDLVWDPVTDGPALVLGGPRSGRSTTLRTAGAAAQARGIDVVRLSGRQHDRDHVADVLAALTTRAARGPGPDPADDRTGSPPAGRSASGDLALLVLVDDGDDLLDAAADPAAVDLLVQLLRSGHRDGIGVMVAGGRATSISRLAAGARLRLVHRTTDRADALVAGVPSRVRTTSPVPGRCLVVGGGRSGDGQPSPDGGREGVVEAQVHLTPDVPARETAPPGWLPRALPRSVSDLELPAPGPGGLPIGVAGPDGGAWTLRLGAAQLWVVAGPAGSGRSTCVRLLHAQALRAGLVVAQLDRATAPVARDGQGAAGPSPAPADLLLVDDAEQVGAGSLEAVDEWLSHRRGPLAPLLSSTATVVVAGAVDWFSAEFRGIPGHARRHGRGLVLDPTRSDVRDVLGPRTPLVQRMRTPGRGLVVDRGRVQRLQVAIPSGRGGPDRGPDRR